MRQRRIRFHCSERTNTEKQLFMKGAFTKHYDGGVHVWSAALLQCIEILGNQSSYTFQLLIYNKPFVFSENIYHNRGYGGNGNINFLIFVVFQ